MKRIILCCIFSWGCYVYGTDHQNISLSWRPSITAGAFQSVGGGLEYAQQMDAFKWGIGLEYPSYHRKSVFLSLQGAWIFQKQSQWAASLGAKLSGGTALVEYWQDAVNVYISPLVSFEYFLGEALSLSIALHVPLNPLDGFSQLMFEIPIGVGFYF